jgi:2-polyprenyl-6-methoxyphenol hydroxylase-like FAD-dependent oxidoreductase
VTGDRRGDKSPVTKRAAGSSMQGMKQTQQTHPHRRAIVLGASIAGLLAARVLGETFEQVLILERDRLPHGPAPRKGTPHALQPHGLLARGREVMEDLFPGLTATLLAQGAEGGDLAEQVGFIADGQPFARSHAGQMALGLSRLALEAELRRRVLARPGVVAWTGVDILAPIYDAKRDAVTGVRFVRRPDHHHLADASEETAHADLVVDCTGRGSRAPHWLARWGFDAPAEDRVPIGLVYVSALFERTPGPSLDEVAVIATATPQRPWPGSLIAQEPGPAGRPRWVVCVGGYQGDPPEPTLDGLRRRARQIGSAPMVEVATQAAPIGGVQRYLFAHSQRRRCERLRRFPQRFLVMGDALCSFNPVYGQGMTVAACEALALREELARGLDATLTRRWFSACARIVETPWQLAVGGDLALPSTPGPRPLALRLTNAYIARLYRAAAHDARLALAFLRVVHMLDAPATLLRPRHLWRVWRGGRRPQAPAGTLPLGQARG